MIRGQVEVVRVAFGAVLANKLRSFLTTLGIIIGIAAVITMVALGEGAQRAVESRLEGLGSNVLTIRPGQQFMGGVDRGDTPLTRSDAEALLAGSPAFRAIAPEMQQREQVVYASGNASLTVVGTWPSYFDVQNHELVAGRLFTDAEERGRRRVAVLGANVGERLGTTSDLLVGERIRVGGVTFEVIGVLEEKGAGWRSPDEIVVVPLATAQFRTFGTDRLRSIYVQATDEHAMQPAIADAERLLRRERRIHAGEESDFNVRDQTALLDTIRDTTRAFTYLLAGIAAISLLVGGIGIMNIMLVSVTERTREIGIRKALGASRRDVLLQFLVEALVLCVAGGVLGVALGASGALLLQSLAGWGPAVSVGSVIVALLFSAAVGLFFGIWPARRAARLDPIVALRYE